MGKIFPKTIEELNEEAIRAGYPPFLISFDIDNQERILRELKEGGITEASLLGSKEDETTKEMETLAGTLREKWALEKFLIY